MKLLLQIVIIFGFFGTVYSQEYEACRKLYLEKSYIEADKCSDKILSEDSENLHALILKALIQSNYFKNHHSAIEFYNKYLKVKDNEPYVLTNLGRNYYEIGEDSLGYHYLKKSLEFEPNNIHTLSSFAYYALEDEYEKIDLYSIALFYLDLNKSEDKSYSSSIENRIYANLGFNYYLIGEDFLSAHFLLKSLEIRRDVEALNNLGNTLQRLGNYDLALKYYDEALTIEPSKIFTLNGKANTYLKMGDKENACKYWKLAIDNGYVFKEEWREPWGIEDPIILLKKHCHN